MKLLCVLIPLALFLAFVGRIDACTAVMAADGKNILVGNNEDNKDPGNQRGTVHAFAHIARSASLVGNSKGQVFIHICMHRPHLTSMDVDG